MESIWSRIKSYNGRTVIDVNWKTTAFIICYWSRNIEKQLDPFDKCSDLNDDPFSTKELNKDDKYGKSDDIKRLSYVNMTEIVYKIIAKYLRNNVGDDFYVLMSSNNKLTHCSMQCLPLTTTQLKHEIKKTKKNFVTSQYEEEIKSQFPNIDNQKKSRVLFSADKIQKNLFELQYHYKFAIHKHNNNQIANTDTFHYRFDAEYCIDTWHKSAGVSCLMNNLPYAPLIATLFPFQTENNYDNISIYKELNNFSKYPLLDKWKDTALRLNKSSNICGPRYVTGILMPYWNSLTLYIKETQEIYSIPDILNSYHNIERKFDVHGCIWFAQHTEYIYSEYLESVICLPNMATDINPLLLKFDWKNSALETKRFAFKTGVMDRNSVAILDNKRYCKYTENCVLFAKFGGKKIKSVDLTSLRQKQMDDNIFDDNFVDDIESKVQWKPLKEELIWKHTCASNTLIDGYYGQSIMICGGKSREYLNETGFDQMKNHCEILNIEKPNIGWMSLPFLNRDHGERPYICLEPDNPNILCCIGGNAKANADEVGQVIEKLDLRDCHKWRLVDIVRYPENHFSDGQCISCIFG